MTTSVAERAIGRVITTPPPAPGFIGEGHTAVMVVDPKDFAHNDPFIVLMDDRIDLDAGRTAGGAHPHAGFETVTLVLEGEVRDRDEGTLATGDVLWMTAGSGVIHNEEVVPNGPTRILQLWLTLPHEQRWAAPRFEHIVAATQPVREEPGVRARLYSGTTGDMTSLTHNYVPVTMLDIALDAGATFVQRLPSSFNGFLYVIDGAVSAGANQTSVAKGQVAWLAETNDDATDDTSLSIKASEPSRVLLYAGLRTGVPIVMHGPFVGESREDLMRVSRQFMDGKLPRLSEYRLQQRSLSQVQLRPHRRIALHRRLAIERLRRRPPPARLVVVRAERDVWMRPFSEKALAHTKLDGPPLRRGEGRDVPVRRMTRGTKQRRASFR